MTSAQISRFRKLGLTTVFAVYVLILVGGAVRASGAGMGCPDWPTCFGRWIPPTSEQQLPADYQKIYADRGYAETRFNVRKTWIEYLNRLLGVSIGIFIFLTMIASRHFRKRDVVVTLVCVAAFFAVAFQGWLGSRVVASNLRPGMITLHMLMAQCIVAMLLYGVIRSQRDVVRADGVERLPPVVNKVLIAVMCMTIVQMVMGTQVRESVDIIAKAMNNSSRELWIERLNIIFYVHRSFSSIILFINLWLAWTLWRKLPSGHLLRRFAVALMALLLATILLGVTMDRLHIPAFAQPLHLWFASLIFGVQFSMYLIYRACLRQLGRLPGDEDTDVRHVTQSSAGQTSLSA
jgi:cytochrome c oxidase assembly protein subunit 15